MEQIAGHGKKNGEETEKQEASLDGRCQSDSRGPGEVEKDDCLGACRSEGEIGSAENDDRKVGGHLQGNGCIGIQSQSHQEEEIIADIDGPKPGLSPMKTDKDLYRKLRALSCETLWNDEVARFDRLTPEERIKRGAVIRAAGVVFSESGTATQKAGGKSW